MCFLLAVEGGECPCLGLLVSKALGVLGPRVCRARSAGGGGVYALAHASGGAVGARLPSRALKSEQKPSKEPENPKTL